MDGYFFQMVVAASVGAKPDVADVKTFADGPKRPAVKAGADLGLPRICGEEIGMNFLLKSRHSVGRQSVRSMPKMNPAAMKLPAKHSAPPN